MRTKDSRAVLRGLGRSNAPRLPGARSFERTVEAFYERLQPFAVPFMALFGRDRLPARSTLSRFVAVLTEAPVEALRTLFLDDLESRPLTHDRQTGGLVDRVENAWVVFDLDGTR